MVAERNTEKNKIVKFKKPLNFNIGMLIFIMVFIYVLVYVIISFQTEKIVPYEVKEGSLAIKHWRFVMSRL